MSSRKIRAGRAFVEIGTDNNALNRGLRAAQQRIMQFQRSVTQMGSALLGTGLAVAAPLGLSVKSFVEFERAISRVRALTGGTVSDIDQIRQSSKKLGATTIYTAAQVADAYSKMAMAGFDVATMLDAVPAAVNLAASGNLDLAKSADIVTNVMTGLRIQSSDLGGAVDVLAKAFTTSNTDLLELGEAFKYVGPDAQRAGLKFEEIVAVLQALSQSGVRGSMAGTAVRGIVDALTTPSKQAAEALREIGVEIRDLDGNMRPMVEILGQFERGLAGLGGADEKSLTGKIFQQRQASGFAALLNTGSANLAGMVDALKESEGTAARIASTMLNDLGGDFVKLTSAAKGLQISIGEIFGPVLRVVTKSSTLATNAIEMFIAQNQGAVFTVGALAAAAIAAGGTLLALGLAIKLAAFSFAGINMALGAAIGLFGAMAAIVAGLVSPMGLIVALGGGLAIAFAQASLKGTGIWTDMRDSALSSIKTIGSEFKASWETIRQLVDQGDLGGAFKVMTKTLGLAWFDLTKDMRQWWGEAMVGMHGMVGDFVTNTQASAQSMLAKLVTATLKTFDPDNADIYEDVGKLRQGEIEAERRQAVNDRGDYLAEKFDQVGRSLEAEGRRLRDELNALRTDAADRASGLLLGLDALADWDERSADPGGAFDPSTLASLDRAAQAIEGVAYQQASAIEPRGTFDASLAGRIGGSYLSVARQMLDEIRKIGQDTGDVVSELRDLEGLAFD